MSVAYLMLAGFTLGCRAKTRQLDGAMLLCLIQGFGVAGWVSHENGHGQVCKLLSFSLRQQGKLSCAASGRCLLHPSTSAVSRDWHMLHRNLVSPLSNSNLSTES